MDVARTPPQSAPDASAILVSLATIAFIGIVAILLRRGEGRRSAALAAEASRHGWAFEPSALLEFQQRWSHVAPFHRWSGEPTVTNLLEAPGVALFEYRVRLRRRFGEDVTLARLFGARAASLPEFVLEALPPHSFLPRRSSFQAADMVRLDLPPSLAADYALFAREPSPRLVATLARVLGDEKGWHLDASDGWLVASTALARLLPARLPAQVAQFQRLLDGVAAFAEGSYRDGVGS